MTPSTFTDHELALIDFAAERTAQRLFELLRDQGHATAPSALVDAQAVADALGCSRQAVYRNAEVLGGKRIGTGPKAPWRFDLDRAVCCSSSLPTTSNASSEAKSGAPRRSRKRSSAARLPDPCSILGVRPAA